MKGLTVFFDTGQQWRDMLEVFRLSWEQHMDIPLEIIEKPVPQKERRLFGLITNTEKLRLWLEYFDQDTIFCDCDMLVRADITDGFKAVKSIGYTERSTKGRPFNAGVVFAKYNKESIKFLTEWSRVNDLMYEDNKLRNEWAEVIPGMNQPALAYMLEKGWQAHILDESYNMCDADRWKKGKMVHIKSEARNICFHGHRRFLSKDYQKALHQTFWAYLGGSPRDRSRNLIEVHKAQRAQALRERRKN